MLRIENLVVYYDESMILNDVNLEVAPGQVVCLMGRNGVGKTTLLKTIMGLLKPQEGKILFHGTEITRQPTDKRAKAGIGYVPQGRDIFPLLTVEENLLLSLEAGGVNVKKKDLPEDIFAMFPVLKEMLGRRGGDLSGGQQQMLAIARALVPRPRLLILDEPTEGIQPSIILDIARTIKSIHEDGHVSILIVEQYLEFVLDVADYFYVMEKGTIVTQGSIREMNESVVRNYLTV